MNWHLGMATGAYLDRRIDDVLPLLGESGVRGVEIGTPPGHFHPEAPHEVEAVADVLRRTALTAVSIHAPFSRSLDLASPDAADRDRAIAAAVIAGRALRRLGGHIVVVHPSDLERAGQDVDARLADSLASLTTLAIRMGELGATLAVESPLPHLIGGHPDELRWLLAGLDRSVRVCLDTGHAALGQQWHRLLDVADGRLAHVHASDNHGTFDDHLPPGDGRIDWPEIGRTLAAADFRGWIMLELHAAPGDPAPFFRRAMAQAARLLPALPD